MRMQSIYDKQEARQAKYPPDRIAFLGSQSAVQGDLLDLNRYANGEIGLQELCHRIAWNNYLERYFSDGMIPPNVMLDTMKAIGWRVKKTS